MDRRVQHHGPSDGHYSWEISLCDCIVMVSSGAGESNHLLELGKMQGELLKGKSGTIVSEEGLHNDTQVAGHQLVLFLGFQGLMSHQMRLEFDVDVA